MSSFASIREFIARVPTEQLEADLAGSELMILDETFADGRQLTPEQVMRAGLWSRAIVDELAWRKLAWIGPDV